MIEIERKFLVDFKKWNPIGKGTKILQGYLSVDPERVVRVRLSGESAFLTIKGKPEGITRTELEYKIPTNEAIILIKMSLTQAIEKTRYKEKIGGFTWEIDVFEGINKGLVLAEIELKNETQKFELPAWIDKEVSNDYRYFNAWLSKNPYTKWKY